MKYTRTNICVVYDHRPPALGTPNPSARMSIEEALPLIHEDALVLWDRDGGELAVAKGHDIVVGLWRGGVGSDSIGIGSGDFPDRWYNALGTVLDDSTQWFFLASLRWIWQTLHRPK